jgi:single-strand DNA-binding protein
LAVVAWSGDEQGRQFVERQVKDMANYNKVMLIGNLTRDPQLSYLPSQTAVVDFGIAVNRRWKGKDGQSRESTCFVDCRAFAGQAETLNKYMSKGQPIFVEGRLEYDTWTAQDGSRRSKHRITVEAFQFLGGGSGGGSRQSGGGAEYNQDNSQTGSAATDDDIPF